MIGHEAKAVVESPVASDSNDNDDRESQSGNIGGPPDDSNDDEREGIELDGSELGGSEVDGNELGGSEVDGSESSFSIDDAREFPKIYDPNSDDCADSPRSYDSNISKETLELGGSPIPSPPRDSQVSSGWLGQAYNAESRRMKKQQTLERLVQVWGFKVSFYILSGLLGPSIYWKTCLYTYVSSYIVPFYKNRYIHFYFIAIFNIVYLYFNCLLYIHNT